MSRLQLVQPKDLTLDRARREFGRVMSGVRDRDPNFDLLLSLAWSWACVRAGVLEPWPPVPRSAPGAWRGR